MTSTFQIQRTDPNSHARTGVLNTRRGPVETPVFMPVGTQAAVKTLTPDEVLATGSRIILANTYHLLLRPGVDAIQDAGGLHTFMNWHGPILTDSGGFQVFSLATRRKVRETGVEFRSHHDGRLLELTPESVIDLQTTYGSDIMMPLDVVAGYESSRSEQWEAAERTQRWLKRAVEYRSRLRNQDHLDAAPGLLFGITQGGFDADFRTEHARITASHDVDGFSIGGLSVGETKIEMMTMLDASLKWLPEDRPRYLMGVGSPEDLWEAVSRGVDMFDCVHPTRIARRGALFTRTGRVNITAAKFKRTFEPVEQGCDCYSCQNFSAAYIHHLFRAGEQLGQRLASIHNLRFLHRMAEEMRKAIESGTFVEQCDAFLSQYRRVDETVTQEQRARWMDSQQRKARTVRGEGMEEKQRAALRAIVTGRVQAVGFRQFVQSRGRELGLAGWVRNSADRSTVEVIAEGESGVLTTFLDHLNDGPPAARVDQVDVEWTTPVGLTEPFEIRH